MLVEQSADRAEDAEKPVDMISITPISSGLTLYTPHPCVQMFEAARSSAEPPFLVQASAMGEGMFKTLYRVSSPIPGAVRRDFSIARRTEASATSGATCSHGVASALVGA